MLSRVRPTTAGLELVSMFMSAPRRVIALAGDCERLWPRRRSRAFPAVVPVPSALTWRLARRPRAGLHGCAAVDRQIAGGFQVYVAVGVVGVDPCHRDRGGVGRDAAYASVESQIAPSVSPSPGRVA